jgi:hypothetical protein
MSLIILRKLFNSLLQVKIIPPTIQTCENCVRRNLPSSRYPPIRQRLKYTETRLCLFPFYVGV